MKQNIRKKYIPNYNKGFDRFILNDKRNPNNYLYAHIRNGLNSTKNIKSNQNSSEIMKKSSSQFFPNNNSTIKNNKKNNGQKNSLDNNNNNNKRSSSNRSNNNSKNNNNNNKLNSSMLIYRNNISVPKDKNYKKIFNDNKNISNSFINNKRVKTPILSRKENNNMNIIYNYENKNSKNKRNNNFGHGAQENKSFRNYNNIFQPVNIFSQFKRSKPTTNENLIKNSQLFKKFLDDEQKKNNENNNSINKSNNTIKNNNNRLISNKIFNKINNNNNYKMIYNNRINNKNIVNNDNNNLSYNIINNTNDTTPINSSNLLNNKSNSIQNLNYTKKMIFDNNIDCREINFHVKGTSSSINLQNKLKPKKKIFKGKKIKCMHDLSKTGLAGDDKKVNQDNYFIFKNFVQGFDNIFMGVCDGHGYYGHEVSGYIKENLPMDLNHIIKTKKLNVLTDDLSSTIKNAFILENKSLLRNRQIDSDLSGSTCISVIYTPKKLIIANIGDSRCVLGKCIEKDNFGEKDEIIGEKKEKNIRWVAQNLSRDHKPTIPEEAERILKIGGRIRPMKDDDGEFIGPLRVYMKDRDMPGLAMTRSFGDYFGSTAGVISEPEVSEYFFQPEDKFIVLASDGLFEFMESQEVIDIIKDYYLKNDIVGCCEYLYKESSRKWIKEEEDTIDDITIILVFFDDLYEEVE